MAGLPEAFEERMRIILGNEYEAFAQSLKEERVQGLRFNTLKAGLEEEIGSCSAEFGLKPVPWCHEGFTYKAGERPGRHPYHDAGVYYIQEPSAMAAVELMDVKPGDKVLDLCAAPGGKSTQIAAKLDGRGLLIANEIHPARAKILSQNIERTGVRNAVVLNEDPKHLSERFHAFFDRILVDAPCSGEGMFRKDEEAAAQWSEDNVRHCAKRGQDILDCAASMLKPGGILLYSTCTFEREEDEEAVECFLDTHRDFAPSYEADPEISSSLSKCMTASGDTASWMYRLWPHLTEGEGAFMAVLRKTDGDGTPFPIRKRKKTAQASLKDKDIISLANRGFDAIFNKNSFSAITAERLMLHGNDLYVMPEECPSLEGLKVMRCGLCLGSVGKKHFEPSHALALAVRACDCREVLSLNSGGEMMERYLRGSTLPVNSGIKGRMLVCADEYSIGWGKAVDGVLKNHYPKGLRRTQ